VPHRIVWSSYTGCWWVGCHIWYSEEGTGRVPKCNSTSINGHCSVPITVAYYCILYSSVYDGPLLCGFNVSIKGKRVTSTDPCMARVTHPNVVTCVTRWPFASSSQFVASSIHRCTRQDTQPSKMYCTNCQTEIISFGLLMYL